MRVDEVLAAWRGGLIVSCQAAAGSPVDRPEIIAALAATAELNGAVGVRIDGPVNIRAVRAAARVPILGIEKTNLDGSDVYITPTFESARRVAVSGADVIALDGTSRPRPGSESVAAIISRIKAELGQSVMADVSAFDEGVRAAEEFGADLVSTTLSGYTHVTAGIEKPDFWLVERLASRLSVPVVCEGRLRTPNDVRRAFRCGAFSVVVGAAITGVDWLVKHFKAATPSVEDCEGIRPAVSTKQD